MKQFLTLLTIFCGSLFGQSIIAPASTVNGVPATNLITICAVNPGSGTCAGGNLVTTYTTVGITVACSGTGGPLSGTGCSNPGNSDQAGNIVAFAALGQYWCQYKPSSTAIAYSIPCTSAGAGGGGGSGLPSGCTGVTGQITCSIFATSNTNGGISATEGNGSALTAQAGVDLLWADSTAHRWKANANNGTNQTVAFLSDIVNVTASALTFHMTSMVLCCSSGTTFSQVTPSGITNTGTATNILASGTEHTYMQAASGSVSGNQAGWSDNAADWFTGRNLYWSAFIKDANADLTNQRLWMGMGNSVTVANYNSDTPGTSFAIMMFRFSSTASDTDWQCVTGTGSAQTVTDSGVAANTSGHFFSVQWISASSVLFSIDGTQVCNNTTNVPAANTQMAEIELITTQTAAAKNLQMAWMSSHMDF